MFWTVIAAALGASGPNLDTPRLNAVSNDSAVIMGIRGGNDRQALSEQLDALRTMRISAPAKASPKATDKALLASMNAITEALLGLREDVGEVVGGDGELAIHAWLVLGSAEEHMADALRTSTVPSYLTANQRQVYSQAIEDKATVQDATAVEAYEALVKRALKTQTYGAELLSAHRRLSALDPDGHPPLMEDVPDREGRWLVSGRSVSPSVRPGFEALRFRDYGVASSRFRSAPSDVDAGLGLAIVQRARGNDAAAARTYTQLEAQHRDVVEVYLNAATFYEVYRSDFAEARAVLERLVDVLGQPARSHEVYARLARIENSEERYAAEQAAAQAAPLEAAQLEATQLKARDTGRLSETAAQVARMHAALGSSCDDVAMREELLMVLDQAQMVIDAGESDVVQDIQALLEGYEPRLKQAGCR